jgi:hypothetical protein
MEKTDLRGYKADSSPKKGNKSEKTSFLMLEKAGAVHNAQQKHLRPWIPRREHIISSEKKKKNKT